MKLPEINPRIKILMTLQEIHDELAGGEYNADLMLGHLILHWNACQAGRIVNDDCDQQVL